LTTLVRVLINRLQVRNENQTNLTPRIPNLLIPTRGRAFSRGHYGQVHSKFAALNNLRTEEITGKLIVYKNVNHHKTIID
jgi:hypothetical protein